MNATNGLYLESVVVSVEGTSIQTVTDNFGEYKIANVPTGTQKLRVTYTGLEQQTATVVVSANAPTSQDFKLGSNQPGSKVLADGSVVLDQFVVAAERYKNAQEIAINDERTSVNIKNVIAADSFGDIPSGNIGEFVKFLPGVQVSYGAFNGAQTGYSESAASGISVRGFGPEDTAILVDGMPVSNASPGSLSRQVGLDMLSINNASRVELIKVATPDMPNNSAGGQVNLITKSAFEYSKPTYSGRVFFNFNSQDLSLEKTVGPTNKKTFKTTPGAEFSVAYPVSKRLGFSVTGYAASQFDHTFRAQPVWTYSGIASTVTNAAGNPVTLGNPVLNRVSVTDIPRLVDQTSANLKVDWKPTTTQLLSANFQASTYNSVEAQRRLDIRPLVAAGADWGPKFTTGAPLSNGTLNMTVTTIDKIGNTESGQLKYRLEHSGWIVNASGSLSVSTGHNRDRANGHYSGMDLQLNPGQVTFNNIGSGVPGGIAVLKRAASGGGPVDYTQISNWSFSNTIAQSGQADSRNTIGLYKIDIDRPLNFVPWVDPYALMLKFGARRDQEKTEKSGLGTGYHETLDPAKSYLITDILDADYTGQSPGFGLPAQQWGSTYKLYQLNQANHLFVAPTDGTDAVGNYNSFVNQQKSLTDTRDAAYAMLTGRFFHNRLSFVGGARQEQEARKGRGPFTDTKWNFATNANGTLYRDTFYKNGVTFNGASVVRTNADGTTTAITNFLSDPALLARLTTAGIKYPDHLYGATASSLEARKLNLIPLHPVDAKFKGRPSYSLNAAYNLTANLVIKAAWSRSFSLPKLEDATNGLLTGNGAFVMTENDTIPADGTKGTIAVANPNLAPSISDNWDFQTAYYTKNGGKFSANYYYKTVSNQPITYVTYSDSPAFNTILDAIGLDPTYYQDWKLTTSTNSSTKQKLQGLEFEVQQDLRVFGDWGRHFTAFANLSLKKTPSIPTPIPVTITTPSGTTTTVTPTVQTVALTANHFAGAGVQFTTKRITLQLRGTYRNDNEDSTSRVSLGSGNFLRSFQPTEKRVDVNAAYRFTERYSLFVSGRDVFNGSRQVVKRDDLNTLPSYAQLSDNKRFGITWTVGVSGSY